MAMIRIIVKELTGVKTTLLVAPSTTIGDVKSGIQKVRGFPIQQQRIVYSSQRMHDGVSVSDYGMKDDDSLFLILRLEAYDPARPPPHLVDEWAHMKLTPQEALSKFHENVDCRA